MEINVDGYKIYYTKNSGLPENERPAIVILHGWGVDHTSFQPVIDFLGSTYEVYALDFPGFGKSPEPDRPIDVYSYADLTEQFIENMGIKRPVIFGHSFGGRIAVILAARMPLTGIILIDAAGIVPKRSMLYYFKVTSYKAMRIFCSLPLMKNIYGEFLEAYRKNAGSDDYNRASQTMKRILSTVVNQDLRSHMKSIKCPSLLFWGELDDATPLSDAKVMESLIPDSALVVVKGGGHYSYLDNLPLFKSVSESFLNSLDYSAERN